MESETYLEQMLVVPHGVSVGEGADFVFEHLLVDAEVGVGVKVVVLRGHLLGAQVLHLLVGHGDGRGLHGRFADGGRGRNRNRLRKE